MDNPREQVMQYIRSNPQGLSKLKAILPQAERIARKLGINMETVATEINEMEKKE